MGCRRRPRNLRIQITGQAPSPDQVSVSAELAEPRVRTTRSMIAGLVPGRVSFAAFARCEPMQRALSRQFEV